MEAGVFYHIYNRGNNRQLIFFEEENYHYFMRRFSKHLLPYINLYAYCLMPNHFHFLIKFKGESNDISEEQLEMISESFRIFFMSYAKSINKKYKRTGSLFQRKFKSKPVLEESYFSTVVQYFHFNPVKAGLCKKPKDWKFSSYNSIISTKPTNLKRDEVLKWFGGVENFIKTHNDRMLDIEMIEALLFK